MIIFPRLSKLSRLCSKNKIEVFSSIGLGDILIPGLSVNYAFLFDIASKKEIQVYFIANIFGNIKK